LELIPFLVVILQPCKMLFPDERPSLETSTFYLYSSGCCIAHNPPLSAWCYCNNLPQNRYQTRRDTPMCFGWRKTSEIFYVLWRDPGVWKTSVCTPGWRHMMAYFHVSIRKISDKISSEWHFWSGIYSANLRWDRPSQLITSLYFALLFLCVVEILE
jgi:hypothetical protein